MTKATTSSESSGGTAKPNRLDAGFNRGMQRGVVPPDRAREHRDFLPQQWTSAVTQRLVLDVERTDPTSIPGAGGGGGSGDRRRRVAASRFEGAGGYGVAFAARWELPRGRPGARYVVGDRGIQCR